MSELQNLYKNLSGTTSQDVTDTSSTVLESILLLKKIASEKWDGHEELQEIANAETKYINAAAKAVSSDIMIQQLYGKDLQAVLKVAEIMKKRAQEAEGIKILDTYLNTKDVYDKRSTAEKQLDEMRKKRASAVYTPASSSVEPLE